MKKAIEFDPNYAEAYNNIGILLEQLGKPDEAAEQWKKAIAANPKSTDGYYNLGAYYFNREEYENAFTLWQKLVEMTPKDPWAHWRLAAALGRMGKREEAEKEIKIFNSLLPKEEGGKETTEVVLEEEPKETVKEPAKETPQKTPTETTKDKAIKIEPVAP